MLNRNFCITGKSQVGPLAFAPKTRLLVAFLAALFLGHSSVRAASVFLAHANQVVLKFDKDEPVQVGSIFDVLVGEGESKGVLTVSIVKGHSAKATLTSGVVLIGDRLKLRTPIAPITTTETAAAPRPTPGLLMVKAYKKITIAISSDSEKVQLTSSSQVTMSGFSPVIRASINGFLGGIFDNSARRPARDFTWELGAGAERIKTTGNITSSACQGSSNCVFDIPSLSGFARLGWLPFEQRYQAAELKIGADFLLPVIVDSNVISYSPFTPLFFATIGLGARYTLDEDHQIPYGLDFASYTGNSGTTLFRILISSGYTWK